MVSVIVLYVVEPLVWIATQFGADVDAITFGQKSSS